MLNWNLKFLKKVTNLKRFETILIMKNKIQQNIYAIFRALKAYASKLRISLFVGGQFKKRDKEKKCFMEWVESYQYLFAFIGLITTFLLTAPILYFTLKDRNPCIKTKVFINELPKTHDTLTSTKITFELKQKTNSISYIENPKVYIRVLYNFSKFLKCEDFEVTKYLTKVQGDDLIVLDKMGQIHDIEYLFGKSFIEHITKEIDGEDVLTLRIYLKYYDKSSHKYRVTNRNLMNYSFDTAKMVEILRKTGDIK